MQVLCHWAYKNLLATASKQHHGLLKSLGAKQVYDYRDTDVTGQILGDTKGELPFILDCIGSKYGSMAPIAKLANQDAKVTVMLPVL